MPSAVLPTEMLEIPAGASVGEIDPRMETGRVGGQGLWIRSMDADSASVAVELCLVTGLEPAHFVIECRPESVRELADAGWLVAVCPDDLGAEPGGSLEAVVTRAVFDGASVIRSEHHTEVRRCMHITAALLVERRGVPT